MTDQLEPQLEAATRAFIDSPAKNHIDCAAGSVQKYLADYVADPEAALHLARNGSELRYLDYDWSLNGTPVR